MCMIRTFTLFAVLLVGDSKVAFSQAAGPTPSPSGLEIIAINGAGKEKRLPSINGVVPMIMVRPNQVVPVTLQFPADKAGTPVALTPLDGGRINGGTPTVLPTGKVVLTFTPGVLPGRYRVMVYTPAEQHLLEFYVVDPANPPFRPPAPR